MVFPYIFLLPSAVHTIYIYIERVLFFTFLPPPTRRSPDPHLRGALPVAEQRHPEAVVEGEGRGARLSRIVAGGGEMWRCFCGGFLEKNDLPKHGPSSRTSPSAGIKEENHT